VSFSPRQTFLLGRSRLTMSSCWCCQLVRCCE